MGVADTVTELRQILIEVHEDTIDGPTSASVVTAVPQSDPAPPAVGLTTDLGPRPAPPGTAFTDEVVAPVGLPPRSG